MRSNGLWLVFVVILLGVLAGIGALLEQLAISWKCIGIALGICLLIGIWLLASHAPTAPASQPPAKASHATFTNDEILHSGVDVRRKDARVQVDAWHKQQAVERHNLAGIKTLFSNRVAGISSDSMLAKQSDPSDPRAAADWIQKALDEED